MIRRHLERLEERENPATVDLSGGVLTFSDGGAENNLTQYVSGGTLVINDSANPISLGSGAIAAGWKGNGTKTITGPRTSITEQQFHLGGGNDTLNLRANDVPVFVEGGTGTDAVNISSNAPTNTGNLLGILSAVDVSAESLWVSDQGATSGNAAVSVDPTGIYGFAGPNDDVPIYTTGTFTSLRISGSSGAFAESYTLAGAAGFIRVDGNAGDDSVSIVADTAGLIMLGSGNDSCYVAPGVTFFGDVRGGLDTDYFDIQGTVAGSVVQ